MGDTEIVLTSIGYFFITSVLLGLAGFTGDAFQLPSAPPQRTDAGGNPVGTQQGFLVATIECIFTIFSDCSRSTETRFFEIITDLLDFTLASISFLFQLLTFDIPQIPGWLNAIIVIPPAAALAYVAFKTLAQVAI